MVAVTADSIISWTSTSLESQLMESRKCVIVLACPTSWWGASVLFSFSILQMSVASVVLSEGATGSRCDDDQKHFDVLRVVTDSVSLAVLREGLVPS